LVNIDNMRNGLRMDLKRFAYIPVIFTVLGVFIVLRGNDPIRSFVYTIVVAFMIAPYVYAATFLAISKNITYRNIWE